LRCNDLSIVTRNVPIKPGLSLGGYAVFAKYDDGVTLARALRPALDASNLQPAG
jgi:hypothetical protein